MSGQQKKGNSNPNPVAEPWEVEDVHHELPTHSYDEVTEAVTDCKKSRGAKKRDEIIDCVRRKFS